MKKRIVSDDRIGTYLKIGRNIANKVFDEATATLYVMTHDRNPVTSLTMAHEYRKGCEPYYITDPIQTFNDLIEDFKQWLTYIGYGHQADDHNAKYELFSYWVKIG